MPSRLEIAQDPITLANDIGAVNSLALAPISVSTTGVLVYQGVGQPTRQMVWMDRAGKQIAAAGEPGTWGPPRISPDGNRAVVAKTGPDGKTAHLWLLDISGTAQQISDGPMHEGSPVWSPDGSRIAYFGRQGDAYDIFARAPQAGAKPELLLKSADRKFPSDWSHDGKYIALQRGRRGHPPGHLGIVGRRSPRGAHPRHGLCGRLRHHLARRQVGGIPVRPVRPQRGLRAGLRRTQQRHQAALAGVQGRRTATLALRQRRTVLHDDRWPHHERVDSSGQPMAGSKPARRRCSSRHGRFPRPGISTT